MQKGPLRLCAAALTHLGWMTGPITVASSRPFCLCPCRISCLAVAWQPVAGQAWEQAEPLGAGLVWLAAEPLAWLLVEQAGALQAWWPVVPPVEERAWPSAEPVEALPVWRRRAEVQVLLSVDSPVAQRVSPLAQGRASPSAQQLDSGLALRRAREPVKAGLPGPWDRRAF